jgi:hypothetical protein
MYGAQYVASPPPQQSVQAAPPSQNQSQPVATPTEDSPPPAAEPTAPTETTEPVASPQQKAIVQKAATSPVTSVSPTSGNGNVMGAAVAAPIRAYQSLNWGKKASLLVISAMIVLLIMKHTLIWREQKRGLRGIWLRAHPLGQLSMLVVVFIMTLASGVGVVL